MAVHNNIVIAAVYRINRISFEIWLKRYSILHLALNRIFVLHIEFIIYFELQISFKDRQYRYTI